MFQKTMIRVPVQVVMLYAPYDLFLSPTTRSTSFCFLYEAIRRINYLTSTTGSYRHYRCLLQRNLFRSSVLKISTTNDNTTNSATSTDGRLQSLRVNKNRAHKKIFYCSVVHQTNGINFNRSLKFIKLTEQKISIRMVQSVSVVNNCIININPATGDVISHVQCTSKDDIHQTVKQAQEAQKSWKLMSTSNRIQLLKNGLLVLKKESATLIKMIVQEMGKPIQEATDEVTGATSKDEYMQILEESLQPQQFGSSTVVRQPFGVVAVLSPWNFPADEILLLALPALACGNTVIVKPSEVVPETGSLVVSAFASVLPLHVFQIVQGDGSVGSMLVQHDGIDMIAMTGSSATGHKIIQQSTNTNSDSITSRKKKMKRFVLEMGGKDPMIVFDDANIDLAVNDAVTYSLSNTGQVCCSIERIFIAQSKYEMFQNKVIDEVKKYKVGNGMDPSVNVGPMVSNHQRSIVQQQVNDAIKDGAKLLYQSDVPTTSSAETSFFPVTVVADVTEEMSIYKDETFGPVITLIPFDGSEEHAIQLANNTEYGLAGSVYSTDVQKAQRVASQIDAGQIGINCYSINCMDVACPWVGHKNSGFGYHSGRDGIHNFSIPKSIIQVDVDDDE